MNFQSPLISLARRYLIEESSCFEVGKESKFSENQIEAAMKFMILLIQGSVDQHKAKSCISTILQTNTVKTYDKIIDILNISNKPIQHKRKGPQIINGRHVACSWSKQEDKRLLAAVHIFGLSEWANISKFVGNNRTPFQCSQRWFRVINPSLSHGPWTSEEDSRLIHLIEEKGIKSWKNIAQLMVTRSDVQCRYHYKYNLANIKKNSLTNVKNEKKSCSKGVIASPSKDLESFDGKFCKYSLRPLSSRRSTAVLEQENKCVTADKIDCAQVIQKDNKKEETQLNAIGHLIIQNFSEVEEEETNAFLFDDEKLFEDDTFF